VPFLIDSKSLKPAPLCGWRKARICISAPFVVP
jgi:hypothetical protein